MLTRQLFRPTYALRTVPFLKTLSGVRRVFWFLPEPIIVVFAIGALAGLRLVAGEKSLSFKPPTLT